MKIKFTIITKQITLLGMIFFFYSNDQQKKISTFIFIVLGRIIKLIFFFFLVSTISIKRTVWSLLDNKKKEG